MRIIAVILAILILCGCAATPVESPDELSSGLKSEHDNQREPDQEAEDPSVIMFEIDPSSMLMCGKVALKI